MSVRSTARSAVRIGILMAVCCASLAAQGKNPLILIPGLSGSELVNKKTGEKIWFRAIKSKSEDLRLPLATNIDKVRDDIIPGDVLRNVKIGPLTVTDVYGGFVRAMEMRGGYHEENWETPSEDGDHDSLYVFPYDWRIDTVENAQRLVANVETLKKKLQRPELRFDIVAHSLGGILSRYAVMYGNAELALGSKKPTPTWAGAKHFDKVILLGTPNEGAASALGALLNGYTIGGLRIDLPFLEDTSKFTVFTIPSAYQLLPAPGTLRLLDERLDPIEADIYDTRIWTKYGWNAFEDKGFKSEFSEAERKIAPQFFVGQLARARRLHEALAAARGKSGGVQFQLIGSDCKTSVNAVVLYRDKDKNWRTLLKTKGFTRADGSKVTDDELKAAMTIPGDGVVSARSLEAATQSENAGVGSIIDAAAPRYVCEEHSKLAANSRIQDQIIKLLDAKPVSTEKDQVGEIMGKGDKRTRRGKIFAGSFGKTRQKFKKPVFVASAVTAAPAEKPVKKRAPKRIPAAEAAEAAAE